MSSLYVLGARQRKSLLKREWEWNLYDAAIILEVNTLSGAVRTCIEYKSPPEVLAGPKSSIVFKSGSLIGDKLYACTSTEVLIFKLPRFEQIGYVSLPCFNDLHHVVPSSDGMLLVANTGLDRVVKCTVAGEIVEQWCVLPEPLWSRFSPHVDYRKVPSTKPHQSHPNFVFELKGETWVTRFRQRDAICLTDPEKRIDLALQYPHDGVLSNGKMYFTLVDGRVSIANADTHQVERVIDLKEIDGREALLGWCRGILPLHDHTMWVGFSRLRKTEFRENVMWAKHIFRKGMREKPSHITLYDVQNGISLREFALEEYGLNIIFSIFSVPAAP
jgi:hypothetical protein